MNILGHQTGSLNDLVFENRNKHYGAYAIRKSYNNSIVKSLGSLVALLLLVFGSAYSYNHFNKIVLDEKHLAVDDLMPPTIETIDVDLTPPTPPSQPETAAAAPLGISTPTAFTDNAIETATFATTNLNAGLGNDKSEGISATSTVTSTNTLVTVATNTFATVPTEAVIFAAIMPEFSEEPNGVLKYVAGSISYPEMAKNIGIEGTVHVTFVVNELGKVDNIKVLKGIGYGCDEEVVRIITKMPKWMKVGKNENGQPVKVRYNIPVRFKLK